MSNHTAFINGWSKTRDRLKTEGIQRPTSSSHRRTRGTFTFR